jgi:hypothetical protein
MIFENSEKIIKYFLDKNISSNSMPYIKTHAKRFAYMLYEINKIREIINEDTITTLDIGPSFFTELYQIEFPNDSLYTLGFDYEESRGGHFPKEVNYKKSCHFHYDLNSSQHSNILPDNLPKFDLVIMAEVIEHLYTSPEIVLKCIKKTMKHRGFIIIQTPNAASLSKRMKLMFKGENPYEMIRLDSNNPGHFREYTTSELIKIFQNLSFKINKIETTNYIKFDSNKGSVQKFLRSLFFAGLRRYIFVILENT